MARTRFNRKDRVSSLIRDVVAKIVSSQVKDPRVRSITITDVEVTGDLRQARVFFAHHSGPEGEPEIIRGLAKASGFIRRALGQQIRMRTTPSLEFIPDHSLDYGDRIEQKLRELGLGQEDESTDGFDGSEE
jgi:ribosome-binding factor A